MESYQKEEVLSAEGSIEKSCSNCKTKKTPLWRGGPAGPKSLCNACGIRHRKKRERSSSDATTGSSDDKSDVKKGNKKMKLRSGLKVNNMMMGWKRMRSPRQWRWGEVERAAMLLMALSCGAVFN